MHIIRCGYNGSLRLCVVCFDVHTRRKYREKISKQAAFRRKNQPHEQLCLTTLTSLPQERGARGAGNDDLSRLRERGFPPAGHAFPARGKKRRRSRKKSSVFLARTMKSRTFAPDLVTRIVADERVQGNQVRDLSCSCSCNPRYLRADNKSLRKREDAGSEWKARRPAKVPFRRLRFNVSAASRIRRERSR